MYRIIQKKALWFSISAIVCGASLLALLIWGLRPGIDFTGGSLLEVSYSQARPGFQAVEEALKDVQLKDLKIQPSGDRDYILRFESIDETQHQTILSKLQDIKLDNINDNKLTENRFESIGPTIGVELKNKAIQSIIVVLICILLYIAYAFRKVSKPVESWKYGVAAIIALLHDVIVVSGVFAILGYFAGIEIDSLFVTALLTVLGFSVHDTIVTFDRIRENLFRSRNYDDFEDIINSSVNETIIRSLNTSLTTLLALLAIYIFGGESTRYFVLALIIGIITGTYSSIFIASPIVLLFNNKNK
ncbi:MAG: protein translocase subunit SecF [Patescibacteria group bacterium]